MATPQQSQQQLQIKSYFARSVQDAIEFAQREMGEEALLLNSRPAPPEARYLGEYEVVFGKYPDPPPPPPPPSAAAPLADVDDLRKRMEEIRSLLMRSSRPAEALRARQPDLVQPLLRAGVEVGLAAEIEDAVAHRLHQLTGATDISRIRKLAEWDPIAVLTETIAEVESRFEVAPSTGRITALVGPPGCGKTTTIVKLAVTQALAAGRSVRLISADTQRIGAIEQLRTYAAILGVSFQAVENSAGLAQAIDDSPAGAQIFIDTPGLSPALLDEVGKDLASFFTRRQDIDTQLVLTATANQLVVERTAERFSIYNPSRLIITRLDEAESLGAVFGLAIRLGKPLSFFCHGQLIPEDIEPASKRRISEALVRYLPNVLKTTA